MLETVLNIIVMLMAGSTSVLGFFVLMRFFNEPTESEIQEWLTIPQISKNRLHDK